MSKYEREWVPVNSLQVGNSFEHPFRGDTICKVEHHSMHEDQHIIGYSIVEGCLHWPVVYLPVGFEVCLLVPTTTFVQLSGKDWINTLTEHHGVKED